MSSNLKYRWTGDRFREGFANGLLLTLFHRKSPRRGRPGKDRENEESEQLYIHEVQPNRRGGGNVKERKARSSPGRAVEEPRGRERSLSVDYGCRLGFALSPTPAFPRRRWDLGRLSWSRIAPRVPREAGEQQSTLVRPRLAIFAPLRPRKINKSLSLSTVCHCHLQPYTTAATPETSAALGERNSRLRSAVAEERSEKFGTSAFI